jgi:hypothetical protein
MILILVLAVTAAIRIRLLSLPLERDEGEYAYGGQLLLQGVPLYPEVYTMKWPGTHAAYALIMAAFGESAAGIHAGLIVVNLATGLLVFVLARRLCGDAAGVVAAGTYALLSINPPTYGLAAHATHFVALVALGGIILLHRLGEGTARTRIFLAGLLLGLAALMKQPGLAFGGFAAIWLAGNELRRADRSWRRLTVRLGCLILGVLLPLLLAGAVLAAAGAWERFWQFTFQYALAYASILTPGERLRLLGELALALFKGAPGLWGAAVLGLMLLSCDRSLRGSRFFILGFAGFSVLALCAGGFFRHHYFLLLVPAAGVLAGVTVKVFSGFLARLRLPFPAETIPVLFFAVAAAWSLSEWRVIFFQLPPAQAGHAIYGSSPFPEAVEIARYLDAHSPPEARIAVLGSEPEIFFYSRRRSATGHIYMYPLMEPRPYAPAMQQEMVQEIEKSRPDYVVFIYGQHSWLQRPDSPKLIFDWFTKYRRQHLRLVAWAEILSSNDTQYHWSVTGQSLTTRASSWAAIFKNEQNPAPDPAPAR